MEDNLIQYKLETIDDDFSVEYEVLPTYCNQILDKRVLENNNNINEIEQEEIRLQEKLDSLNNEVDRLTNHADSVDYTVAVASGIVCGLIDSFFIGEFDVEQFKEQKEKVTENFKKTVENKSEKLRKKETIDKAIENAKKKASERGEKLSAKQIKELKEKISQGVDNTFEKIKGGEDGASRALKRAISLLEKKFKIPSDDLWNGAGINVTAASHHLDDIAHHPSLLGLLGSFVSQIFRLGIFVNKDGEWHLKIAEFKDKEEAKEWFLKILLPIGISALLTWLLYLAKKNGKEKIDEKIPKPIQKLILLLAEVPAAISILEMTNKYIGHLVSDMAGSSTSAGKGKDGMGIPGIFMSVLKELSSIPPLNLTGLPKVIDELYEKERFDMRAEIAALEQLGKQAIPVIINEILVRTFYFIRHLVIEIKKYGNIKDINWKNVIPFNNRTIARMITISSGTFTAIDLADATIRSAIKNGAPSNPAFWKDFVLRVNFVGIGRFAIAVGTDIGMGVKRNNLINERIECNAKIIQYQNAKIFYSESNMWVSAENVEKSMQELYKEAENCIIQVADDYNAIQEDIKIFGNKINDIEKINPGIRERLKKRAIWGK